jgi:hypothetical protein
MDFNQPLIKNIFINGQMKILGIENKGNLLIVVYLAIIALLVFFAIIS